MSKNDLWSLKWREKRVHHLKFLGCLVSSSIFNNYSYLPCEKFRHPCQNWSRLRFWRLSQTIILLSLMFCGVPCLFKWEAHVFGQTHGRRGCESAVKGSSFFLLYSWQSHSSILFIYLQHCLFDHPRWQLHRPYSRCLWQPNSIPLSVKNYFLRYSNPSPSMFSQTKRILSRTKYCSLTKIQAKFSF